MDKTIMDTRKRRVRQWIDDHFEGNVAAFCRYYGFPPTTASYLSQLFNGLRNFGEKAARQMEQQAGKPKGWLDWPDGVAQKAEIAAEPPLFRYSRDRVAALPERERQKIADFIEFTCAQWEQRHTANAGGKVLSVTSVQSPTSSIKSSLAAAASRPASGSLNFSEKQPSRSSVARRKGRKS